MEKEYNGIKYEYCQYETLDIEERKQCCEFCIEVFGENNCTRNAKEINSEKV